MVSERDALKEKLEELSEVQTEIFLLKEKSSILDNENKALRVQIEKLKLELKQRKKVTKAEPKIKGRFYTVKKGDSLWRISQQTGVSVADLRKLNNITGTQIRIGQKLLLTP